MLRRRASRALCLLLAVTVPLQGCAWLFQSKQGVLVTCATPGASLIVDGRHMALANRLQLQTGVDHVVECVADGYAPKTIKIAGHDNIAVNWLICDILWILVYGAGIVFLIVDFTTESIWDLEPRRLIFNLDPLPEEEPEPDPAALARAQRRDLRTGPAVTPRTPPGPDAPPPVTKRAPAAPAPTTETTTAPPANPLAQGPASPPPEGARTQTTGAKSPDPPPANPLAQGPTTEAGREQPPFEARPASATEAPPPPRRRSVHVLTVGVDAPADPRLPADPRRAELASKVAGFPGPKSAATLLGEQATRRATLAAVAAREGSLGPDDVLVVVVAAPACVDPDGAAWLLLADADPSAVEDTALGVDVLTSGLERSGAGMTVVAVFAGGLGPEKGERRDLDAAAFGPGFIRVVTHDATGAESIRSTLRTTFEDLAGPGVVTDVDGNGELTAADLTAYLKGRSIGCEVAPP